MNRVREIVNIILAIAGILIIGILIALLWINRFDTVLTNLVVSNFPAIIGLQFAFVAAFIVVALFRQGADPMEFGGFGLTFKGSAGEIVLWILSFLAITGTIHMLWRN